MTIEESTAQPASASDFADLMTSLITAPAGMIGAMMAQMVPTLAEAAGGASGPGSGGDMAAGMPLIAPEDAAHWAGVALRLQTMWFEFQTEQAIKLAEKPVDPAQWLTRFENWARALPGTMPEASSRAFGEALTLWQGFAEQVMQGEAANAMVAPLRKMAEAMQAGQVEAGAAPAAQDRRFAAPQWREQPAFAFLHRAYLAAAEQITTLTDGIEGIEPTRKAQLRFAVRTLVEALSPDHFPLSNPLVIERAIATRGESLIKGMEHLIADLRRGQLTHTDPAAFSVGENIAITPGKVDHETALFQLIQYTPTTPKVMASPLVIFPPWINRFYILDLNAKKSFVRWAVEQGITVFMVSWKSADASMAEVIWDDYIAAQIHAIDVACARCKVEAAHVIGYCVAGTTLAATLAVLARHGEAAKVKTATFFTAQVDFEKAGDLLNFVDDQQIAAMRQMSADGYLDGRYMAATFNLLRGQDLIWNYVISNYLLGEDYKPFDMLHWNGDTTNLPAKWHCAYLTDLYRDNRLVQPDSLSALGTPIDLRLITTPCFIQAGREDHIAPPESVWRITRHLAGEWTFLLAGSGHIAGVVNPPSANKYQYWTNDRPGDSLDSFVAGATETKGSWWPYWVEWLRARDPAEVPARGKRVPGGRGDKIIEDAPGRYVRAE